MYPSLVYLNHHLPTKLFYFPLGFRLSLSLLLIITKWCGREVENLFSQGKFCLPTQPNSEWRNLKQIVNHVAQKRSTISKLLQKVKQHFATFFLPGPRYIFIIRHSKSRLQKRTVNRTNRNSSTAVSRLLCFW